MGGTVSCFPIDVENAIFYELKDRPHKPILPALSHPAFSQLMQPYKLTGIISCLLSAVFIVFQQHIFATEGFSPKLYKVDFFC